MRRPNSPFSGKMVVFGGDSRQRLLMVSRGFRATIDFVALLCPILWHQVRVLILTKK